jgi:hypothetical protein
MNGGDGRTQPPKKHILDLGANAAPIAESLTVLKQVQFEQVKSPRKEEAGENEANERDFKVSRAPGGA